MQTPKLGPAPPLRGNKRFGAGIANLRDSICGFAAATRAMLEANRSCGLPSPFLLMERGIFLGDDIWARAAGQPPRMRFPIGERLDGARIKYQTGCKVTHETLAKYVGSYEWHQVFSSLCRWMAISSGLATIRPEPCTARRPIRGVACLYRSILRRPQTSQ